MKIENCYVQYTISVYHDLLPNYKYNMVANALEAINKKMNKLGFDIKESAEYLENLEDESQANWLREKFGLYYMSIAKTYLRKCRLHPLYL